MRCGRVVAGVFPALAGAARSDGPERARKLKTLIRCFAADEAGTTAIEYSLIATLVSAAIIVGAIALGGKLGTTYGAFAPKINGPG